MTILSIGSSCAKDASAATTVLLRASDWTVYVHESGQTKVCFASAPVKSAEPAGALRDGVALFVSAWPRQGVKSEVSFKLGPLRKGSDVVVIIGTAAFRLFPAADRAFVNDPTEELKLLEAMKKGSSLTVQSVPAVGAATQRTFSLAGLTQALQALATSCP